MIYLRAMIHNQYLRVRSQLDLFQRRLFRRMPARPNFLELEITWVDAQMISMDAWGRNQITHEPMLWFPACNAFEACQNGWFETLDEYRLAAALIFALRFPNHPYARHVRQTLLEISDEDIRAIASGHHRLRLTEDAPTSSANTRV